MGRGASTSCVPISARRRRCRWRTTSRRRSSCRARRSTTWIRSTINPSVKLVANCERRLFQRPDDAIHRGVDVQAESDIAGPGNFLSNFEPLTVEQARTLVEHVVEFDRYTEPMKQLLAKFVEQPETEFIVSSAHPRLVNGKRSTNPRYLQIRPDLANARELHLARSRGAIGARDRGGPSGVPAGERGAGGKAQQSGGQGGGIAAAGGAQSDSLPGTARAVHGFHLQPHRQIAGDDGLRQRGRADQDGLQRAASGGGSE